MTVTGMMMGHKVSWDGGVWRYDDGLPAPDCRTCSFCDRPPEQCPICDEPHDPCIGHVDGARSVCCGHGQDDGFVLWPGVAAGCSVETEQPSEQSLEDSHE